MNRPAELICDKMAVTQRKKYCIVSNVLLSVYLLVLQSHMTACIRLGSL